MKIKLLLAGLVLSVVTPMAQANASCETGYESAVDINATTNVVTYSCVKSERQIAQLAQGAWVKVDANGDATGQAIVCSADVCGDSKSPYARATLKEGEQYVLQAVADPITNNVAGVGNNNANTQVQVDLSTQEWTITRTNTATPKEPVFINGQQVISYIYQTVDKFTADKAPWVDTKESVEVVVEPAVEPIFVAEAKTKTVKAKKAKAKKKAARK